MKLPSSHLRIPGSQHRRCDDSDIDSLIVSAGIHAIHFGKYHRLLSKRFPFAVYYRVEEQTALVYAVLDCRQRPAWIRKKLN